MWTHARVPRRVRPLGATSSSHRPPARPTALARRRAARQHARLPLRVRRRGADRRARSSGSTTRGAASTCSATSSTRTAGWSSPSRATAPLLAPIARRLPPVLVSAASPTATIRVDAGAARRRARRRTRRPGLEPDVDTLWALIFTSGTSDAPKAVICSQRRLLVTGNRMAMIMDLGPDDVGYVCMPLFHSNAVQVGWAPSLVVRRVGRARPAVQRRRAGCADVRRYGATYFNYTGKPLAYLARARPSSPTTPTTRCASRSATRAHPRSSTTFARRFGVEVIDAYGATEGGVAVNRDADDARRARSGTAADDVQGRRRGRQRAAARRASTRDGRLLNADDVRRRDRQHRGRRARSRATTTTPRRPRRRTRFGWYWSGDLGYLDDDGYLYFAGRNADWIRVDGENFPAGPIEAALRTHPDVVLAAVYGVPDDQAGDQVMAGARARATARAFDPAAFARVARRAGRASARSGGRATCGSSRDPPTTGTNKIVKRTLVHQKFRPRPRRRRRAVRPRPRRATRTAPFTAADEAALHASFVALRAASGSGTSEPWTSRSRAEEQAFAAEVAGLARARNRRAARRAFETHRRRGRVGPRVAGAARRRRAGSASTGRASTAAAARRRSRSRSSTWSTRGSRAPQPVNRVGINLAGPDAARARHRRAEAALAAARSSTPTRSGASCSASPTRAPTSRRCRPRAMPVDGGWLLTRSEGVDVVRAVRAVGHLPRPHRSRRARSTAASRTSSSTCRRRASRSGRSCRSPARPSSTRCSSTRCSCPTTISSAGCNHGLGGREHDARPRARHRVPVQGAGRARGVPRRAVRGSRRERRCSTTSRSPTRSRRRSSSCASCGCTTGARCRGSAAGIEPGPESSS